MIRLANVLTFFACRIQIQAFGEVVHVFWTLTGSSVRLPQLNLFGKQSRAFVVADKRLGADTRVVGRDNGELWFAVCDASQVLSWR